MYKHDLNTAIYMLMWRAGAEIEVAAKTHYSKGKTRRKRETDKAGGGLGQL